MDRPQSLNLANWRQSPQSAWAFHHVGEVIPAQTISRGDEVSPLEAAPSDVVANAPVAGPDGASWSCDEWLQASTTDALLVAHKGRLVHEWYANDDIASHAHIVFSVSKSITATLAGIFIEQGVLDVTKKLEEYIPELKGSGYQGATLQNQLDMAISIDFEEDYEATGGRFIEYRASTGWHPCEVSEIDTNLHDFLVSLPPGDVAHGYACDYKSPNSDLLGWVIERATGEILATLFSRYLWQPMGAEGDALITVDRKGAPRSAGGFCALPRDLLRFGEMVRQKGFYNNQQVVPESWIAECCEGGDPELWARNEYSLRFPEGNYHNKWYQARNGSKAVVAIGIHSQWIYIDPVAEVSIVKLSAQHSPLHDALGTANLQHFAAICDRLNV